MRRRVIFQIARHQVRAYARDGRYLFVALTLLSLFGLSLWSGWRSTALARAENARFEAEERRRWLDQGEKFPHSAADQGIVVAQPLLPLAAFDPGVLPFAGALCRQEGHHETLCAFRPASDGNSLFRFAYLTPARVAQVFLPLLMVLLIYSAVSAERESGILKQILSAGVSGGELLMGKLGGATTALAPVLVVMALGASLLVTRAEWTRAITLLLAYLMYFAGFGSAFLTIAAYSTSAGQALSRLLACWFAAAFLGPVVASQLAAFAAPIPHPMEWTASLKEMERGVPTVEERRKAVRARLLEQYGLSDLRDLPVNPVGVELVEENLDSQRIWGERIDQIYRDYSSQDRIYAIAGLLDPVLAIQAWSAGLTEADNRSRENFRRAVEQYRRNLVLTMNDYLVHDPNYHTNPVFPGTDIIITTAGRELWEKIPAFRYDIPRFDPLARSGWSMAGLLLWLGIGVGAMRVAAARAGTV